MFETGFIRFYPSNAQDFAHDMGEMMPREQHRTIHEKANCFERDVYEYLMNWTHDTNCLPIPNKLKNLFASLATEDLLQREALLNFLDRIQARQRENERRLWTQFRRELAHTRRTRSQGMTFEVANFFATYGAAHGSMTSELKEFRRWAAARTRVYQPL